MSVFSHRESVSWYNVSGQKKDPGTTQPGIPAVEVNSPVGDGAGAVSSSTPGCSVAVIVPVADIMALFVMIDVVVIGADPPP